MNLAIQIKRNNVKTQESDLNTYWHPCRFYLKTRVWSHVYYIRVA